MNLYFDCALIVDISTLYQFFSPVFPQILCSTVTLKVHVYIIWIT